MIGKVASSVALLLMAVATQAEVYKWTDDEGKVHYSQTPPTNVPVTTIKSAAPPSGAGQPDEALQQRLEDFDERRKAREASAGERAAEQDGEKIRAENCERARANATTLQSHGQVSLKEGDTYRALGEEERQAKIAEAEGHVKEFCGAVASGK